MKKHDLLNRRRFLLAGVGAPAAVWVACRTSGAAAGPQVAAKSCVITEDNIEGPFFKAGAPSRVVMVNKATRGTRLWLSGRVVDTRCRPIAGATMEVWHADHTGDYDNTGFRFRATLQTDRSGGYALATIIPGRYLNGRRYRPAHIHVKLHAPGFKSLTTQLYFKGDPYNAGDPFIRRSLIMPLRNHNGGKAASYELVLARR